MNQSINSPSRCQGYLAIRLRRMVQNILLREKKGYNSVLRFRFLPKDQHFLRKTVWALMFVACLALFFFQSYDRISYYFTYPVAYDVSVTKKSFQKLPQITICYQETKRLFQNQPYLKMRRYFNSFQHPMLGLLFKFIGFNAEELWQVMNTSTELISAKAIDGDVEDLLRMEIPLLYGTCTTFRIGDNKPLSTERGRYEIVLDMYNISGNLDNAFDTLVFIHDPDEQPQSRRMQRHLAGRKNIIKTIITEVQFINRTTNICTSAKEYEECLEACRWKHSEKLYAKYNLTCRISFHIRNTITKRCVLSRMLAYYWASMDSYLSGYVDSSCVCPRKCQHRTFNEYDTYVESYHNQSVYELGIGDAHETLIKERLLYDLISLFCDIGGNSGLYVGLSLLSVFEFIHVIYQLKKKCYEVTPTDPLFCKVMKTYENHKNTLNNEIKGGPNSKVNNCKMDFKMLLISSCMALLAFATVNRTMYYLDYPIRAVFKISFNSTILSPSLVICQETKPVYELRKKYARLHKVYPCKIEVFHLLNLPHYNSTFLWEMIFHGDEQFNDNGYLPYIGRCMEIGYAHGPVSAQRNIKFGTPFKVHRCYENDMIFFRPHSRHFDYLLYLNVPEDQMIHILYVIKEIIMDESLGQCVEESVHAECKRKCLNKKLLERVHCSLPYMVETSLPLCNSSSAARYSHNTFLELFVPPRSASDCLCLPQCHKTFYDIQITTVKKIGTFVTIGAAHNVVISYMYESAYPLVKLLCDIGGWLGATLGFCVLSIFEQLLSLCTSRRKFTRA